MNTSHTWRFFRTCGLDQADFRSGAGIARLADLDQKLWTALSCPTQGVRFDAKTLELLDSDHDGRIRAPELIEAVAWLSVRLTSLDPLLDGSDTVRLASLNAATPEGQALLANAKRILANLGKPSADAITLADVTDTARIFAGTRFNGDGIVPADAAEDPAVGQAIEEIIALFGAETDRSGKPGVNQAKTDAFFAAAQARLDWLAQDPGIDAAAHAAVEAVRAKIDEFFLLATRRAYSGPVAIDDSTPLADRPVSLAFNDGDPLPLDARLNPAWSAPVALFRTLVVAESASLRAEDWAAVKARFAPRAAWLAAEAGKEVAALAPERLRALVSGDARVAITALIAKDAALAAENAQIAEVERLIRYHANLATLLGNYVNMGRLYDPKATAIFQVGTLYMDARACNLCFHVDDVGAHAALAAASKCCLAYCALTRPGEKATRTICAVFTAGFAQSLWAGRNGIFYDPDGKDWDATVVKLVDNAISLKEAFWDPWRKIAAMISGQVNKLLASKQDAALAAASKNVENAGTALPAPAPADAPKKMEGAALASSVAALGIAVGLIGSAVGGLVSVIAGLPLWKTALGVLAVILAVSCPSVILAWFKLRARDIAPILNACGWAVNRPLRFSLKLGRLFTAEAALPAGAERELSDPYADNRATRAFLLTLLALALLAAGLWFTGLLDNALPVSLQRAHLLPFNVER
jgi:hypothetical protein